MFFDKPQDPIGRFRGRKQELPPAASAAARRQNLLTAAKSTDSDSAENEAATTVGMNVLLAAILKKEYLNLSRVT